MIKIFNSPKLLITLSAYIILVITVALVLYILTNLLESCYFLLNNNIFISSGLEELTLNSQPVPTPYPGAEASDIIETPMPGVKCPKCEGRGVESWVLPGKHYPKCGHPC